MSDEHKKDEQKPADLEDLLEEAREQDARDVADVPDVDDISLEEQIADLKDQLTRSQADYHNLVRRMRSEQESLGHFTRGKTIVKILPILDTLERAIEHMPEDLQGNVWVDGVTGLHRNMVKILSEMDIESFDSLGQTVDPDRHDVVSQGPGKEDEIIAQVEKGYMHGGEVLRHAKVVVGNGEQ